MLTLEAVFADIRPLFHGEKLVPDILLTKAQVHEGCTQKAPCNLSEPLYRAIVTEYEEASRALVAGQDEDLAVVWTTTWCPLMNHISLVGKYLERFYIRRNQLPGLVEIGTEAFARAVAGAGLPPDALQKLRDDLETRGQGQASRLLSLLPPLPAASPGG